MGAGLFAAQTGLTVADTYLNYQAERSKSKYEQTVRNANASTLRLQAEDAISRGSEAASGVRRGAASVRGQQATGYAGQGVDVGSGTAATIQAESSAVGEIDAINVKNNAWREAWGLRAQASEEERLGRLAKLESKNKRRQSLITGGLNVVNAGADYAYRSK